MDEQNVNQGTTENTNSIPAEGKQEASMPDVNQQPTNIEGGSGELPEAVSERTREQFEKLQQKNKELSEKLTSYEKSSNGNVFDYLSGRVQEGQPTQQAVDYSHLNQNQVDQIQSDFVDDNGYVDVGALNKALTEANRRAARAEQKVSQVVSSIQQKEEKQQVKEAHEKHPWLDPADPNFDQEGFDLVRDRMLRNMWEGKDQSLAQVAKDVLKVYRPKEDVTKAKQEAVEQYKQDQTKKVHATQVEAGKGQPRNDSSYDDLRHRTRLGDEGAIDSRIDDYFKSLE